MPNIPSEQYSCVGIILAAGQSQRMQRGNKLLKCLADGRTMIEHVATNAVASELSNVKMIVSSGTFPEFQNVETISSTKELETQSDSVKLALSIAQNCDTSHLMVLLGDMPFVTTHDINTCLSVSYNAPDKIIYAAHDGQRGNPCILPMSQLAGWTPFLGGDYGAWQALQKADIHPVLVECGPGVLIDIDTKEDLEKHLSS